MKLFPTFTEVWCDTSLKIGTQSMVSKEGYFRSPTAQLKTRMWTPWRWAGAALDVMVLKVKESNIWAY